METSWQKQLSDCVTSMNELAELLCLDPKALPLSAEATYQFACRIPRDFIRRMTPGDAKDPLLLQVLPALQEMQVSTGFVKDPLDEGKYNPVPGLLHKYKSRVLFTLTGACAINCRYCFRRHFPYAENNPSMEGWERAIEYIRADNRISEVILSGGDPLLVKDAQLQSLIQRLESVSHLKRLRIHTRLPIVIPDRITLQLVKLLDKTLLSTSIVFHANHPNEIDKAVHEAVSVFQSTSVSLFNQSVLLEGINDNADALCELSEKLFDAGVLPYYLHLLDPVAGAEHFLVDDNTAKQLIKEMRDRLSGYLVPTLVREVPGMRSKQLVV